MAQPAFRRAATRYMMPLMLPLARLMPSRNQRDEGRWHLLAIRARQAVKLLGELQVSQMLAGVPIVAQELEEPELRGGLIGARTLGLQVLRRHLDANLIEAAFSAFRV